MKLSGIPMVFMEKVNAEWVNEFDRVTRVSSYRVRDSNKKLQV